jgi:bifunctional DNA-binding transcriptional regulator/antitoxin component of YhaV-PrlF toxin-antitoxin module
MAHTVRAVVDDIHELPLPEEVRRRLGIVEGSTITYLLDENGVRILPVGSSIAHLFGSIEPLANTSEDFDREIEEAMQGASGP